MKRFGLLSAVLVATVALISVNLAQSPVVRAAEPRPGAMVVVLADADSLGKVPQGATLAKSFTALLATLQDDQPVTFLTVDDPPIRLGPFGAGSPELEGIEAIIESRMDSPEASSRWVLASPLAEAHDILSRGNAAAGSTVYILATLSAEAEFDRLTDQLAPLVAQFQDRGWAINGVSLPNASLKSQEFLRLLSAVTDGEMFELSALAGLKQLADSILSKGSKGSLTAVGGRDLTVQEVLTAVVNVAPGTSETSLLLFKESPYGSLRLSNPDGFDTSFGDRTASYVTETPHVVIWRLLDPVPGNWRIDVRGIEGEITAWEYSSNKYSVSLRSAGPVPLNEPTIMVASVLEGGRVVPIDGVKLHASITPPGAPALVYALNDEGIDGDAAAGDGYFSVTLPPLSDEGEHKVELRLSWLEQDHQITSQSSFHAQVFPALEVRPENLEGLTPGERARVATVYVHIEGSPYPVPADRVVATMAYPDGQEGVLEVEPRRLFGDGPAWEFDVFLTPQEGLYTLIVRLDLEYAGRAYTNVSSSFVASALAPAIPVEPRLVPAPAAPVAAPRPVEAPPIAPTAVEPSGFEWGWLAALSVLLLAGAAAAAFLFTRPRPFGYLYDDTDKPLVDFSDVKRHPVLALLFRGLVRGREINVPGLEGVDFRFSKSNVSLRSVGEHATIRINNQPLSGQATLGHRTWIGTRGKLYSFLTTPPTAQEPAGAD